MVTEEKKVMLETQEPLTWDEIRALLRREPSQLPGKTWKPTTGGLLAVIAGGLNILLGILGLVGSSLFASSFSLPMLGVGVGVLLIVLGIVSVIGGSFALRRRLWGMALAGSITALFPSLVFLLGTLSIIFVTLGRPEFGKK